MKTVGPLFALLVAVPACVAATLRVQVLDETGQPVPARVYLTDASGNPVFPEGALAYKLQRGSASEQHFMPARGQFTVELKPGPYRIELERGKEYLSLSDRIEFRDLPVEKTYRLRRWINMRKAGWYSADMHSHRALKEVPLIMEAEDIDLAMPISRWRVGWLDGSPMSVQAGLSEFLSMADQNGFARVGSHRWMSVVNEELEDDSTALLASNLGRVGSDLHEPFSEYGRRLRRRGALVDSEKALSRELAAIAALNGCDLVGLAHNHIWRSGCLTDPWGLWPDHIPQARPPDCLGEVLAGLDFYYALLNSGFSLNISAGSASGVHPVPMGWNRIYAHLPGRFSPSAWFEQVRKGRTFVTNGPMLLLTANGFEPGDQVSSTHFPLAVHVRIEMWSPAKIVAAELIVNGEPLPVQLSPLKQRPHAYAGEIEVSFPRSSWIAARWIQPQGQTVGLAHTAPIGFRNGDQPFAVSKATLEYLLTRVEDLLAEQRPADAFQPDRIAAWHQAADAYRSKLRSLAAMTVYDEFRNALQARVPGAAMDDDEAEKHSASREEHAYEEE